MINSTHCIFYIGKNIGNQGIENLYNTLRLYLPLSSAKLTSNNWNCDFCSLWMSSSSFIQLVFVNSLLCEIQSKGVFWFSGEHRLTNTV